MSQSFFEVLSLHDPDYNLGIGSGRHGKQTADMIAGVEEILLEEGPDCVLTYGDTNSTLAAAIATSKTNAPLGHIEAGLRSFNRSMPEETNRVLTDHASDMLFCPSEVSYKNLVREGIGDRGHIVGDLMVQLLYEMSDDLGIEPLSDFDLHPRDYMLLTMHRQENVDSPIIMERVMSLLCGLDRAVVFPAHPRTMKRLAEHGLLEKVESADNITVIEPQDFLRFSSLERNAEIILTDSGGVQKDAYVFGVPCVTLREETEWSETVNEGWNTLAGTDPERILRAIRDAAPKGSERNAFGGKDVAKHIIAVIEEELN